MVNPPKVQPSRIMTPIIPAKMRSMIKGGPGFSGRGDGEGVTESDCAVVAGFGGGFQADSGMNENPRKKTKWKIKNETKIALTPPFTKKPMPSQRSRSRTMSCSSASERAGGDISLTNRQSTISRPIWRAVPAMTRKPASSLREFRSLPFSFTMSITCLRVTLPTFVLFGSLEPAAMFAAFFKRTAAGGLFGVKGNDLSLKKGMAKGGIVAG